MTRVRMIRGGFGLSYTDDCGAPRFELKTPESGPFECSAEDAARLVAERMAEYTDPSEEAPQVMLPAEDPDEEPEDAESDPADAAGPDLSAQAPVPKSRRRR